MAFGCYKPNRNEKIQLNFFLNIPEKYNLIILKIIYCVLIGPGQHSTIHDKYNVMLYTFDDKIIITLVLKVFRIRQGGSKEYTHQSCPVHARAF